MATTPKTAFALALSALIASGAQAEEKKINLLDCEPFYPLAEVLKETGEAAQKWEVEFKATKEKHQKFVTSCNASKQAPNQPELLKEYRKNAEEYLEESHKLSNTTKELKEKLFASFDGLVRLKSKKCAEQVSKASKVVSAEASKEISKSAEPCANPAVDAKI